MYFIYDNFPNFTRLPFVYENWSSSDIIIYFNVSLYNMYVRRIER